MVETVHDLLRKLVALDSSELDEPLTIRIVYRDSEKCVNGFREGKIAYMKQLNVGVTLCVESSIVKSKFKSND